MPQPSVILAQEAKILYNRYSPWNIAPFVFGDTKKKKEKEREKERKTKQNKNHFECEDASLEIRES